MQVIASKFIFLRSSAKENPPPTKKAFHPMTLKDFFCFLKKSKNFLKQKTRCQLWAEGGRCMMGCDGLLSNGPKKMGAKASPLGHTAGRIVASGAGGGESETEYAGGGLPETGPCGCHHIPHTPTGSVHLQQRWLVDCNGCQK